MGVEGALLEFNMFIGVTMESLRSCRAACAVGDGEVVGRGGGVTRGVVLVREDLGVVVPGFDLIGGGAEGLPPRGVCAATVGMLV